MIILLHSSKTMRHSAGTQTSKPEFLEQAIKLIDYLKTLDTTTIAGVMKISPALAAKTRDTIQEWSTVTSTQTPVIDCFLGDIYSGLQAASLDTTDRAYAQKHLRILSGLYGILRPLDGISPYRLEMAYRLPNDTYQNLYKFWGDSLAKTIGQDELIINVSSVEYSKALLPYLPNATVITPRFLTVGPKTKEPKFVVVHAKIARGAYARWLIKDRVIAADDLRNFSDLNYKYDASLSTPQEPVYVAQEFGGLGLSVRLT